MNTSKKATAFERLRAKVTPEHRAFAALNLDIIDQIHEILNEKNWTQRQLSEAMGKRESEISKLLSGAHNLSLQTIAKISVALGETIISTPLRHQINRQAAKQISFTVHTNNDDFSFVESDNGTLSEVA